ncbi:hypothetical protein GOEFS_039_00240 [Gordonia effusa NBRC 100432]|uniref:Uncharacterized protein n=2 Tax=Gordonia effusa TaxID=263908 RepID=H0QY89_9ACTN|nr:hypothetical protein GOEFS_039_00240 [Gordonia effusa NBRC 100432]
MNDTDAGYEDGESESFMLIDDLRATLVNLTTRERDAVVLAVLAIMADFARATLPGGEESRLRVLEAGIREFHGSGCVGPQLVERIDQQIPDEDAVGERWGVWVPVIENLGISLLALDCGSPPDLGRVAEQFVEFLDTLVTTKYGTYPSGDERVFERALVVIGEVRSGRMDDVPRFSAMLVSEFGRG